MVGLPIRHVGAKMTQDDVIARLTPGMLVMECGCGRPMNFPLGQILRYLCDCGAIWAWDGSALERRRSARRATLDTDGEMILDQDGAIVWEWSEKDDQGQWVDGRR